MITFAAPQCARIAAKLQTRTTRLGRRRWVVGGVHELRRGRQGPIMGYLIIEHVSHITLGSISEEMAQAEGFSSLAGLKDWWRREMGPWHDETPAWDVRFRFEPRAPTQKQQRTVRQQTLFD